LVFVIWREWTERVKKQTRDGGRWAKKDASKLTCVPSYEERKQGYGGEEWEGVLGNEIRM